MPKDIKKDQKEGTKKKEKKSTDLKKEKNYWNYKILILLHFRHILKLERLSNWTLVLGWGGGRNPIDKRKLIVRHQKLSQYFMSNLNKQSGLNWKKKFL